ncbi:MAG: glycosyltransferase family 2 protein [Desulfobacteraceae bacterium]|jgi:glycosyltransferase involved in cell wall biosynthesis
MKTDQTKISATVITKNESDNLAECLESLSWVDEIVIVDSGSTDDTVEIAKKYTDKVYVERWRGQGAQKNRAVELARGPWILSIDADERVPSRLAAQIRKAIADNPTCVFSVRRKNMYQDRWVRHCGWWPDWVVRVFRKDQARFSDHIIHESIQTKLPARKFPQAIVHHSFKSPQDFLNRAAWYAHHKAIEMHRNGRRASVWTAVSHACYSFVHTYVIRLGFLDGAAGMLIAVSNFVGVFYRYMIIRDLNTNKSRHTE